MTIVRRAHRLFVGMCVVVAVVVASDGGTVLRSATGPEVAGVTYERSPAGRADRGESLLLDTLPLPEAEVASPPVEVTPAPPVEDAALVTAPEAFDEPAPPPPPPPPVLRSSQFDGVEPSAGTWAVMIGINDYPGLRYDLKSAVNDVNDVNEALARMGVPGGNRLVIRDGQATAGTIRAAADWLRAHAGPDAVAVFFYAGHVRKLGDGVEGIVGADGGVVSDAELAQILAPMQARRAWIGIAACYGGGFTEVLRPGWVLTAAANASSVAYENQKFGRSYLVEYMVRRAMIEDRASSSVEAAFAWAHAELARDYPDRMPVQFDDDPSHLDLRPPKPQSPPSSGSPPPSNGSPPPSNGAPPPSDGSPPPPDPDDGCGRLTAGVVRCGD